MKMMIRGLQVVYDIGQIWNGTNLLDERTCGMSSELEGQRVLVANVLFILGVFFVHIDKRIAPIHHVVNHRSGFNLLRCLEFDFIRPLRTREEDMIQRALFFQSLERTFLQERGSPNQVGHFEKRTIFMKERVIFGDVDKPTIRHDAPERLARCMTNDLVALDKAGIGPYLKGLTIEITTGLFRIMPDTPRTHAIRNVFNRDHRNTVFDLDDNRCVASHGVAVQDFGSRLGFFDLVFRSVNERAAFECRDSSHRFARQEAFRSRHTTKTVDGIANNLQAVLTSIENRFFERIRFGGHESLDCFATLEEVPQETRHNTCHVFDKPLRS